MLLQDLNEFEINITKKNIAEGLARSCTTCPGALAIKDYLNGMKISYDAVYVFGRSVQIYKDGICHDFESNSLGMFIEYFDYINFGQPTKCIIERYSI